MSRIAGAGTVLDGRMVDRSADEPGEVAGRDLARAQDEHARRLAWVRARSARMAASVRSAQIVVLRLASRAASLDPRRRQRPLRIRQNLHLASHPSSGGGWEQGSRAHEP